MSDTCTSTLINETSLLSVQPLLWVIDVFSDHSDQESNMVCENLNYLFAPFFNHAPSEIKS